MGHPPTWVLEGRYESDTPRSYPMSNRDGSMVINGSAQVASMSRSPPSPPGTSASQVAQARCPSGAPLLSKLRLVCTAPLARVRPAHLQRRLSVDSGPPAPVARSRLRSAIRPIHSPRVGGYASDMLSFPRSRWSTQRFGHVSVASCQISVEPPNHGAIVHCREREGAHIIA